MISFSSLFKIVHKYTYVYYIYIVYKCKGVHICHFCSIRFKLHTILQFPHQKCDAHSNIIVVDQDSNKPTCALCNETILV